ncbi:type 1 glutamine amidotransferase [Kaistia defluvii]|uniref:type 1 glutamine amidotransferase n=1 Tax=Kaistia defluvii TaxID=410841 RepID=UPI00224CC472|nr:type 1 glutamine amidotransferase [Kaistia defluvii]MCX5520493.1 type 1 glutamine amidotransferase [Kaistia defluvii]
MRILVVENYQATSLGLMRPALASAGAVIDVRRAHEGDALPETPDGYDAIIVLGGGQSAVDDAAHPYLPRLARLMRAFGDADKSVLGICLGSQILARGYGASNILGRPTEFGWQEVTPTEAGRDDPVVGVLEGPSPLFHWHSDTFTLPEGAVHLATSALTPHQAFRIGRAVYGIQFHFEADTALVRDWSDTFGDVAAEIDPEWPERHAREEGPLGSRADAAGRAIARAWIATIR